MDMNVAKQEHGGESGGSKALLALVIGMGVLIVIGVAVLIGVVVTRIMHGHHAVQTSVPANVDHAEKVTIPLLRGEHITRVIAMNDGDLAVSVQGDAGERLFVWAPESGRVVSEAVFIPAP
ncbi:hypothetical protein [Neokomagataea thailandica]|uniref:Uncharacterized protein n=1 Tax=Neokomagataea tanensis NBRC 106556 TaxID=1223519 RepID=A0ABQ0QIB5_9PROT|nr:MULTISPECIES: hypothetical protein [Neokomagataea]GBR45781.1 hypothetical protein AA106556_0889 [Neokomagataea tanensis NBRC 106556]